MCLSAGNVLRSQEALSLPDAGVTGVMPPSVGPGNSNSGPLQEWCVLFLSEPSPAPKVYTFQQVKLHVCGLSACSFLFPLQGNDFSSLPSLLHASVHTSGSVFKLLQRLPLVCLKRTSFVRPTPLLLVCLQIDTLSISSMGRIKNSFLAPCLLVAVECRETED